MTGGFLKTAICVSLLVHAAGWCVLAYLPRLQSSRHERAASQPMMLAIEIIAEPGMELQPATSPAAPKEAVVEPLTPQPQPAEVKPAEPQIALVPEAVKAPLPEPTPIIISATPAPVQSVATEPLFSAPEPEKREADAASPVKAVADPAQRASAVGERILVRAQPNYRRNTDKIYPLAAIRRREEGLVIVSARIDIQGRAQEVKLKQSSGYELLDAAAVTAVRSWEFEPARINGEAVASQVEVPVNFKLAN